MSTLQKIRIEKKSDPCSNVQLGGLFFTLGEELDSQDLVNVKNFLKNRLPVFSNVSVTSTKNDFINLKFEGETIEDNEKDAYKVMYLLSKLRNQNNKKVFKLIGGEFPVMNLNFPTLESNLSWEGSEPVEKGDQTLSGFENISKTMGDEPFDLPASTNAGLPVVYASSNTEVATVSGNTVTVVGEGESTITANQAGNENWNPLTEMSIILTVTESEGVEGMGFQMMGMKMGWFEETVEETTTKEETLEVDAVVEEGTLEGEAIIEGKTVVEEGTLEGDATTKEETVVEEEPKSKTKKK